MSEEIIRSMQERKYAKIPINKIMHRFIGTYPRADLWCLAIISLQYCNNQFPHQSSTKSHGKLGRDCQLYSSL